MIVLIVLLFLIVLLMTVSHAVYHRSVIATLIELVCSAFKDKSTEAETTARLMKTKLEEEPVYVFDGKMKCSVSEEHYQNLRVFTLNESNHTPILFYIHGGAYTGEIGALSWRFLNQIVKKSHCEVRAVVYPLAPWHTWEDSYSSITDYYTKLRKDYPGRKIFLCGDSAGGGLALGIAIHIAQKGLEVPQGLVLISPWVETTETNPDIPPYEKVDPILASGPLRASAQAWAGDEQLEDWHISPINGDLGGLRNVHIFVGTREMFYPDDVLLHEKLKALGVTTTLTVGPGMNHCYAAFPIPEGNKAVRQIAEIINEQV